MILGGLLGVVLTVFWEVGGLARVLFNFSIIRRFSREKEREEFIHGLQNATVNHVYTGYYKDVTKNKTH